MMKMKENDMNRFYEVEEVRKAISCPVPSITPQFFKNGEIDWDSTGKVIENILSGGATALLVTFGDSLLSILTDQETMQLNRFVTDIAAGRAMVIACSKQFCHRQMLEYAEACREYGCDLVIPFYPDWAQSLGTEELAQCFREIGRIMPVMMLSNMTSGRGIPQEIYRVLSPSDGIVAVKDDMPYPYGKNNTSLIRDKFAYLSGGRAFTYMDVAPFGADGYLSVYARVFPGVSNDFWKAYHNGDLKEAVRLVEEYDSAFFDFCAGNSVHFSAAIQGLYEIAGVGNRWRRAPYSSLNDDEMAKLLSFANDKKLL